MIALFLSRFGAKIAAVLAVLLVAVSIFFGGASWQAKRDARAHAIEVQTQLNDYRQAVAKEVQQSQDKNKALTAALKESKTQQESLKSAAMDRLFEQLARKNDEQACVDIRDFRFDVGTVRLLDAARANMPASAPATGSDAASRAPSSVGVPTFVANDLEVVRLYHELATRHNALVDYLEQKQKEQSK